MKTHSFTKRMVTISATLLLTIIALNTFAQDWENLGSRKANFALDHDVINVTYRDGYFTAVKLEVTKGAMDILKCTVHFENGSSQEVELRHKFKEGSTSRVIDLKGDKRYIRSIEFWYDTEGYSHSKAVLTVFGKK